MSKSSLKNKLELYIKQLYSKIEELRKQNDDFYKITNEFSPSLSIRIQELLEVKIDLEKLLEEKK